MPAATALWRLTGTCWSSVMGPSLSQPLAPVKGAAAGRGGTVACGDEPIPAHERRGTPASNWSCGGSLREGSLSNTDVCFITNGNTPSVVDGDHVSLSLCSDNETDLIRELQTSRAPASQSQISARLLSPRRTSLSSLALQVDNLSIAGPTMKQQLDHRRPAAVTPPPSPP